MSEPVGRRLLRLTVGLLLGGVVGLATTPLVSERMTAPVAIAPANWRVISPSLQEDLIEPEIGRGTHVSGGALVMTEHAFFRPDMLVAQLSAPAHRIDITLLANSSGLIVNAGGPPAARVILYPEAYQIEPSEAVPSAGRAYTLFAEDGGFWLDAGLAEPVRIGPGQPGAVELSTVGPQSRVDTVRIYGVDGAPLLEDDFDQHTSPGWLWAAGAARGADHEAPAR